MGKCFDKWHGKVHRIEQINRVKDPITLHHNSIQHNTTKPKEEKSLNKIYFACSARNLEGI